MKILQLIQKPQLRGAEVFACQLATHLKEQGHDVWIVSLVQGEAILPFRGTHIELKRPLGKRMFDLTGWRALARLIKDFNPDVVQANAGDTLKFAVFSKLLFSWNASLVFRNANKVSDFIKTKPKLRFNKFLVNQVQYVISVSELCRLDFVKTYSYQPEKTITIPIGIEGGSAEKFLPDLEQLFTGNDVLVHVASFVPEKNHEGLIRIFAELKAIRTNIKLVLLGDGRLRNIIEEKVREQGLLNDVLFLGYRKDVLSIMKQAKVFVLPSLIEGLPGVILEAMSSNLPVVAYNVGGVSEVVQSNRTGWLVEKNNEVQFVKSVVEVLTDHAKRSECVDAAYKLVETEYNNKALADRFESVYLKLLNKD